MKMSLMGDHEIVSAKDIQELKAYDHADEATVQYA